MGTAGAPTATHTRSRAAQLCRPAAPHIAILLLVCALVLPAGVEAKRRAGASRNKQTADQEMRLKKLDCERNTCSHLDGESRLNCNYKCISEPCYQEIYGQDELEEGEVDTERGRLFGFCYRRFYRQQMEERKERVRQEAAEQRARNS